MKFHLAYAPIGREPNTFDADYIVTVTRSDGKGMGKTEAATACRIIADGCFRKKKTQRKTALRDQNTVDLIAGITDEELSGKRLMSLSELRSKK